jgi:hypothetical protein
VSEIGKVVEEYATRGLKVFPLWWPVGDMCACPKRAACDSPAKHPLNGNGCTGATADLDVVRAWWRRWPDANVGLAAGGNGFAILDVDPKAGGFESFGELAILVQDTTGIDLLDTLGQTTGSGGLHLLFTAPEGGVANGAPAFPGLPGLDVRGRGGYIVAPPSMHVSGRRYEWDIIADPAPWPDILTVLRTPVPKPRPQQRHPRVAACSAGRYGEKALTAECDRVAGTAQGGRNHQLVTSAYRIGQLVGGGQLSRDEAARALYDAALQCGLSDKEATGAILRGLAAGESNPRGPVA